MNKLLFLVLLIFVHFNLHAQTSILRHYDPNSSTKEYFYTTSSTLEVIGRFEPEGPGWIKSFTVGLHGDANGTVKMHFLGHDGGTAFPQLEEKISNVITINKTIAGYEEVQVVLATPIYVANNQFFMVFYDFQNNARLAADKVAHAPSCRSTDGGDYYYTYLKINSPSQLYPHSWTVRGNGLWIDVEMEYTFGTSPAYLEEITATLGIDTNLSSRSIAWADYNNDNYLDLLVAGRLYKNNEGASFTDVTTQMGIKGQISANAFLDMNNDGIMDILLLGDSSRVLIGQAGYSNFTEHKLSISASLSPQSVSIADVNNDGYPDVFVGQLWSTYPNALPNYYFKNTGNLDFTDKSTLIYPNNPAPRRSRGSRWVDFDNDGDLDLYITNYYLEPDEFYRNNGNGTFTDIISSKNIDKNASGSNHGTGVDWADYDNDGDMDLLLPQFAHPWGITQYDHRGTTIYRNSGAPDFIFTDTYGSNGIEYEETHAGAAWGDVNNDGLTDFLITTYYGCRYIDLYLQQEDNTFELATYEFGLKDIVTGEDAVWVDFNNDGMLDLASGKRNRIRLYKNRLPDGGHWVELELKSTSGNSTAVGSRVVAWYDGKPHMKDIVCGHGQRMMEPGRLHFGLGGAGKIDSLQVWWNGKAEAEVFYDLNMWHIYKLTEGGQVDAIMAIDENEGEEEIGLKVYPNPTAQGANLSFSLNEPKNISIRLTDIAGKVVLARSEGSMTAGEHTITIGDEVNSLASGTYIIELRAGYELYTSRLIVK